MPSHREAKREIQKYFSDNWASGLTNGLPNSTPPLTTIVFTKGTTVYSPKVFYQNIEKRDSLPLNEHFALFTVSNKAQPQASLRGGTQQGVGTKFTTFGIGIVDLFFAKSNHSTDEEDYLTAIAHEMFLAKRSECVWFRETLIKELQPEEKYFRNNVTFEYRYDTVVGA